MTTTTGGGRRWLTLATHVPSSGAGGGMIRYTVEFLRALRRVRDVDLHVLAHPQGRAFFADLLGSADRVHVTPDLPVAAVSLLERRGIDKLVRGFDVVHGTKHLLPAKASGTRRVLTCHDMLPLDRPGDFGLAKRALLREPYLASLRAADTVLCVSEATRQRALCYVPELENRSVVVPLATDALSTAGSRAPVGVLLDRPFVLVVGDDSPRKNLRLIVRAMTEVVRERPDAILAIAGPPNWGVSDDAQLLDALVSSGNAVRLGFVSDEELTWCYRHARVVCCPALLEGFGLPAKEALNHGAPVLTSDDPALCEVSGPTVPHLSSWRHGDWVQPILALLGRERSSNGPAGSDRGRTWDDVARESVEAVMGR